MDTGQCILFQNIVNNNGYQIVKHIKWMTILGKFQNCFQLKFKLFFVRIAEKDHRRMSKRTRQSTKVFPAKMNMMRIEDLHWI